GHKPGSFIGQSILDVFANHPDQANIKAALAGAPSQSSSESSGLPWEGWYIPLKDDKGEVRKVAGVTIDLTEVKRTERELRDKIGLMARQQQVIQALATPIIEVWDRVLTLPMLGVVDSVRASEVMENLLSQVSKKGARFAILDLTGVEAVDTGTAR